MNFVSSPLADYNFDHVLSLFNRFEAVNINSKMLRDQKNRKMKNETFSSYSPQDFFLFRNYKAILCTKVLLFNWLYEESKQ